MADKNVQNSAEIRLEIKLNEVFLGKRRLRYIYLYEQNIVSVELEQDKQCMPLFLACDVLDECSISSGNLPRFHAKHAKRGLATKVNFQSGVRVVGIHGTARGVWFYSIQGLFKIAFEYYSRDEQQHCLTKLRQLWLRQILDPDLATEVHVVFQNRVEEFETLSCKRTEESIDCNGMSDVDKFVCRVNEAIDSFVCENDSFEHNVELLKTYLLHMKRKENLDSFLNKTLELIDNCLKLLPVVSEESRTFSDTHSHLQHNTRYENSSSNRFQVSQNENYADPRNVSENSLDRNYPGKDALVLAIAQWLGAEFLNYHADIIERVTSFKQRNMSSIGNLPSAEDLVNEVFPTPMKVFLCSWLEVPLTNDGDHAGTAGSHNRSNLFPVIQLILELANQSLVSGVAHVLFSQLVQSDSVE